MVTINSPGSVHIDNSISSSYTLSWAGSISGQTAYEVLYRLKGTTAWSTTGKITSTATTYDLRQIHNKMSGVDFKEIEYRVLLYYTTNNTEGTLTGSEYSQIYEAIFDSGIVGYLNVQVSESEKKQFPIFDSIDSDIKRINVNANGTKQIPLVDSSSPLTSNLKVNTESGVLTVANKDGNFPSAYNPQGEAVGNFTQYVPKYTPVYKQESYESKAAYYYAYESSYNTHYKPSAYASYSYESSYNTYYSVKTYAYYYAYESSYNTHYKPSAYASYSYITGYNTYYAINTYAYYNRTSQTISDTYYYGTSSIVYSGSYNRTHGYYYFYYKTTKWDGGYYNYYYRSSYGQPLYGSDKTYVYYDASSSHSYYYYEPTPSYYGFYYYGLSAYGYGGLCDAYYNSSAGYVMYSYGVGPLYYWSKYAYGTAIRYSIAYKSGTYYYTRYTDTFIDATYNTLYSTNYGYKYKVTAYATYYSTNYGYKYVAPTYNTLYSTNYAYRYKITAYATYYSTNYGYKYSAAEYKYKYVLDYYRNDSYYYKYATYN